MTREETRQVLAVMKAVWPNTYARMSKQELTDVVNIWHDSFEVDPVGLVGAAVKAIINGDEREFPPTIGQVRERMRKLSATEELSEGEAWALIRKAVSNSAYGAREEFDALPPVLQRVVGSPSQLKDWSQMDIDAFNSVVASNVQRAYKIHRQRETEQAKLPESVKRMIGSMTERMALHD